jgi:hypothetical protein
VYELNLTGEKNAMRFVGRHRLMGYQEEQKTKSYRYQFRDVMISDHPLYAPPGQPKANRQPPAAPVATRTTYRFYVGDDNGQNVDYAPSGYAHGDYTFSWFNPRGDTWVHDPAVLGRSALADGSAGGSGQNNVIKTRGLLLQSSLFDNRLVATFGRREDRNFSKPQNPAQLLPSGWEFDFPAMDGWRGDWAERSGKTQTNGVVVRPLRGWKIGESMRTQGALGSFAAEAFHGLQFHYNESDSFRPATPAVNLLLEPVPNPTSLQKEFGFSVNLWDNRVVFRFNRYDTKQLNSRSGPNATVGIRVLRRDFEAFRGAGDLPSLQRQARLWVAGANPTFSSAQVDTEVYRLMQLTPEQHLAYENTPIAEISDITGKGEEYELHFNPTSAWTLRLNATRQITTDANIAPSIGRWLEQRMPVWLSIIDPRTNTPWYTTRYGANSTETVVATDITGPLEIARALEGKRRSQNREWRVNLTTSYALRDLTSNRHLSRMKVGAGVRWQSTGAIGYYGIPVNGDINLATSYDPNRPILDDAQLGVDVFAGYNVRLFRDRVRARFQLNVRNVEESGGLRAVGAYPDGRPHTFRIVDPRQFILTTTFEL